MRQLQIIPESGFRLYGAMVAKEIDLARRKRGTFHRHGAKAKNHTKWTHSNYPGWINISRGMGEIVLMEVHATRNGVDWQLLQAILGFIDRHFSANIKAIYIQYA